MRGMVAHKCVCFPKDWNMRYLARFSLRGGVRAACGALILATVAMTGCSRQHYRLQADREVNCLVSEKSNDPRWAFPGYTIQMNPEARYFDPTNPDHPPMPEDDPYSHRFMHCVDGMKGFPFWHIDGDYWINENPAWMQMLGEYAELTPEGRLKLTLDSAVELSLIHSPDYYQQIETIYLSSLDVSTERFRFDYQFYGGINPVYQTNGRYRSPAGERNLFTLGNSYQIQKRFATGAQLLVGFANTMVWQFTGQNTNTNVSLLNFSLIQPLLRGGGQAVQLEQLTIAERTLLANLRAMAYYRQGFYTNVAVGVSGVQGPQRRGGFFGGTGLTGFTGQGSGGFGGVGGATNFGRGGINTAGGNAGGAGSGFAGGGAGNVGGFIGLAQSIQNLRNLQDNLALQVRSLKLLEANLEAGLINLSQVDQFRQSVETQRAQLLGGQVDLENQIETFKRTTMGLPPDTPIDIDDSIIKPFQLVDPTTTGVSDAVADFIDALGELPDQPEMAVVSTAIDRFAELRTRASSLFNNVKEDLDKVESARTARERGMDADQKAAFEADTRRLVEAYDDLQRRFVQSNAAIDELRMGLNDDPDARAATTDRLVAQGTNLSSLIQELSLVQARARVESVTVDPLVMDPHRALQIARAYRLDWMNNRANLVDTWRLIRFNANALRSNLTVTFAGNIATTRDNMLNFNGNTGQLTAGLQFDPPFTRLLERNNYRSALISYQQDRRQLYQYEDTVNQLLRNHLRNLDYLAQNLEIQRLAVGIAVRRVDQTREVLNEPPPPVVPGQAPVTLGPTAALDLLNSLADLRNVQNNFMSVWLNYYAERMTFMKDLGLLQLNDRGLWVDIPIDQLLGECDLTDPYPLPPEAPQEWLDDAGVRPEEIDAPIPQGGAIGDPSQEMPVLEMPSKVRWEEMTVKVDRFGSREEAYMALARAGNQVLEGVSFGTMAKLMSDGPTAGNGGRYHWTRLGTTGSEQLEDALVKLPVGAMSQIIEEQDRFTIVRVVERDNGEVFNSVPVTEIAQRPPVAPAGSQALNALHVARQPAKPEAGAQGAALR